jgi:methylase of polypeptide subunit release factors
MPIPHAAPVSDVALCQALAADLASAGYTTEGLRELWGPAADGAIGRGHALPARRLLAGDESPLAVIARLFGIGDAVADADGAFPRVGIDGLEALGLVARDGDLVRPLALVRPQAWVDDDGAGEWWIASDLDEAALGGPLPEDHVLGAGGASLTLAGLQLTSPAARALDLGTGCGIQALRARRQTPEVVATDISERALAFARLNAALNGVDGIETRRGDMFEPVRGELFDRIVSNPPFVITPRSADIPAYEYRDAGRIADGIVAEFVGTVGVHLEPGGSAQLLGNWETRDGVSGLDRVRAWVEASAVPLDAWVVEREDLDPIAYAELWIRDGGTVPGMPRFDELLGAWLDDFDTRGVTAIGFGYIILRRPSGGAPTLSRYERIMQPLSEGGLGSHLTAALEAHDRLVRIDDRGLAASVLVVAPDVTEARHHLPGAADPSVIELRQGGGFARVLDVDPALAALVGACDGDLPLGPLIDAIAELLETDAAPLRRDLLPRVRELLFTGFLRFAD